MNLTKEQKQKLCDTFNNDRAGFSDLAYEFAGQEAEGYVASILDRLNELYRSSDLAFGRDDTDNEEVSALQERLLSELGIDIGVDEFGKAFLIKENDIVVFETNDGLSGCGIVHSITDDDVTLEIDPMKIGGRNYDGNGLETFDKNAIDYMSKAQLPKAIEEALSNYIQLSRIDYNMEMGMKYEKAKEDPEKENTKE